MDYIFTEVNPQKGGYYKILIGRYAGLYYLERCVKSARSYRDVLCIF
jgi:hypothetical protein